MLLFMLVLAFAPALSIVASASCTCPTSFAYDEQNRETIAYDGGLLPAFNYDSPAVPPANKNANRIVGAGCILGKFGEFLAAKGINNPVPSTLARVIPGESPFPTLGPPTRADVFVTDAAAIRGMTPAQIAPRLGIQASDKFTVIEFPSAGQGLASPVFRSDPGFIGRGLTSGGAPEFVIPNGPIPPGATTTIIR